MKKLLIYYKLWVILLLIALVTGFACSDDEENDAFRLISLKEKLLGDFSLNSTVIYQGEKISFINYYYDDNDGKDTVKEEYSYPMDNNIVRIKSYSQMGKWILSWKEEMYFENGQRTLSISYNYDDHLQTWKGSYKVDYIYGNAGLAEETSYFISNDQYVPSDRTVYDYKDGLLFSIQAYNFDNNWVAVSSEKIYYNGEKPSYAMFYNYSNEIVTDSTKYEFIYDGDLLTKIEVFNYGSHEQKTPFTFTYDSHGNLVKENIELGEMIYQMDYTYEKGKGNFQELKDPGGGWSILIFYPYPTKSGSVTSVSAARRFPAITHSSTRSQSPFQGPGLPNM